MIKFNSYHLGNKREIPQPNKQHPWKSTTGIMLNDKPLKVHSLILTIRKGFLFLQFIKHCNGSPSWCNDGRKIKRHNDWKGVTVPHHR